MWIVTFKINVALIQRSIMTRYYKHSIQQQTQNKCEMVNQEQRTDISSSPESYGKNIVGIWRK